MTRLSPRSTCSGPNVRFRLMDHAPVLGSLPVDRRGACPWLVSFWPIDEPPVLGSLPGRSMSRLSPRSTCSGPNVRFPVDGPCARSRDDGRRWLGLADRRAACPRFACLADRRGACPRFASCSSAGKRRSSPRTQCHAYNVTAVPPGAPSCDSKEDDNANLVCNADANRRRAARPKPRRAIRSIPGQTVGRRRSPRSPTMAPSPSTTGMRPRFPVGGAATARGS